MNPATLDYASDLGVAVTRYPFESGTTYEFRVGVITNRFTHYHGDNEVAFERRVVDFLGTLPWPSEDDPRITDQGVEL